MEDANINVVLDTNCLYTTQAGTARYTRGLLSGFTRLGTQAPIIKPLSWPVENFGYRQPLRALKTVYREFVWCRTAAFLKLKTMNCDLLHRTSRLAFTVPQGLPSVYTLYDLAVLQYPERFRHWHRMAGVRFLDKLKDMERIICISKFTADEAMRLIGLPSAKLEVVYCASDLATISSVQFSDEPLLSGLPDEFFLFVGSLEPGKNLALLKNVYELARHNGVCLPPLVIAGARWLGVSDEGRPHTDWHYLGRVSDRMLVSLYKRARGLLFPSKYEGFGIPLVEAMSLGCPVICAPVASLPEVGGDAVLYADLVPGAFLEKMTQLLSNTTLETELRKRGIIQSSRFSWKKCAQETLAVYHNVLK